jgi:hypothetical protein
MAFKRNQYMNNPNKYLSPPISPKQYFELSFQNQRTTRKDIQEDWISVESLPPSPPSTSYVIKTTGQTLEQEQQHVMAAFKSSSSISASARRKQKKPNPSLPSSTAGVFQMPFVSNNSLTRDHRTSIAFISPEEPSSTLPQFPNDTEVITKKKRKHRNDCATDNSTICLASIKKQHSNSRSKINYMSIHAILDKEQLEKTDKEPLETQPPKERTEISNDATATSADEDGGVSKKAKTDAALVYDNLSADSDQATLFRNSEEWIPSLEVFNRKPTVRISWKGKCLIINYYRLHKRLKSCLKGSPLRIKHMPYFEKLHSGEATIAGTLRLTPEQYLKCKWALVLAAKHAYETKSMFRKSEAQKVCCIDVNKTSVLWNTFGKLGWLGSKWPQ